ncbi:diaminopimelate epimerase [Suttonella sp. R2A3]|uniref:diaminopimelate epimerase n=1 Tax=Suttonella sp. R2A3 TaxID=2908648 RepID=UPI001F39A987|nr:diaminopimelate epimerase [Suttonella sp. R2A3]
MHGLGNDFVVLNALGEPFDWSPGKITALADRYTGIGFDQLLVVEPTEQENLDFAYRIFNADGSEVEHCGNGARCFGKFVRDQGLCPERTNYRVAVKKGTIEIAYVDTRDEVDYFRVDMGEPDFTPLSAQQTSQLQQPITVGGRNEQGAIVSMGNPHVVLCCQSVDTAPVATVGAALQDHSLFPEQVNVGFMQVLDRGHIRLRVFERGVGETQACGTGACAAVATGIAAGDLDSCVRVDLLRGSLEIFWQGVGHPLMMIGPAETVYHGELL